MADLEKQISIMCRGITRCVDTMPYASIQKGHIYLRIAAAMLQASRCEMTDAILQAQACVASLVTIPTPAPITHKEPK